MRAVPAELAARLEEGAASLCHAWILTRGDGVVLGFTDHDRDLLVEGVTCRAATGWTAGAHETAAGFAPGLSAALGALDDGAVTAPDIEAGLYDGASVACLRVDWSRPDLLVRLWTARIARIRREGEAFTAELEGPLAALDRVAGRTFGRLCDAVLGDGRCGVSATPGVSCDKRWRTCVDSFANGVNFRGFPAMPGEDFLTLYPSEGERHDGGKR
ncbi:baseplate hub protein [Caulobacter sp. ErkDOM-E]|uniref:baseplate hub domain-containing protein n=1 Tax=Caulobacter sp. ErkDOM-E TaxID=3402778 RepID=UPI003AF4DAD2